MLTEVLSFNNLILLTCFDNLRYRTVCLRAFKINWNVNVLNHNYVVILNNWNINAKTNKTTGYEFSYDFKLMQMYFVYLAL